MAKLILGFAGEIASGKGTAAKHLIDKYGAKSHRFSTMLRDLLDRLHMEHSRDNMQRISTALRQEFGQDLMAKVMFNDAKNDAHDLVVVEGVRRIDDIAYLKKLPEFKFIYIEVGMEKRHERLIKRNENPDDSTKTFEEFKKDHLRETEFTIPGLKKEADYVVDNNGSLEDLYKQIDEIIAKNEKISYQNPPQNFCPFGLRSYIK